MGIDLTWKSCRSAITSHDEQLSRQRSTSATKVDTSDSHCGEQDGGGEGWDLATPSSFEAHLRTLILRLCFQLCLPCSRNVPIDGGGNYKIRPIQSKPDQDCSLTSPIDYEISLDTAPGQHNTTGAERDLRLWPGWCSLVTVLSNNSSNLLIVMWAQSTKPITRGWGISISLRTCDDRNTIGNDHMRSKYQIPVLRCYWCDQ